MFDEVQFTLKNREIEYDQWSDWQKVGRQLIAIFYSISVTHSTWNNVIFLITSHSAKVLVHRFTAVGGFAIMIMKYCQYIFHPLHGLFIQSIYECERIGVCVCEYWKQIRPEKKKAMNIWSRKSEFNFILCFYLFVLLRFQCIWFMVEMFIFFAVIDLISLFTWNSLRGTCALWNCILCMQRARNDDDVDFGFDFVAFSSCYWRCRKWHITKYMRTWK